MFRNLDQLADRLRGHVQRLASEPRPPGTEAHQQARKYVRDQFQQAGFQVDTLATDEAGLHCESLLTRPVPAASSFPLLIIGAHYDSVVDSPGADDNASAVAALLELARWLGPKLAALSACPVRVQLAAYDLEEYGLVGSFEHARELHQAKTRLCGMISLEMLGYVDSRPGSQHLPAPLVGMYPNVGNFIGIVGNDASVDLLRAVTAAMKSVPDLPVETMAVPGDGRLLGETRLSDHSSFWDHGYSALMITDTSFFRNPHYHRASDTPDTLNYDFLARVTAGVCAAVWRLLQAE